MKPTSKSALFVAALAATVTAGAADAQSWYGQDVAVSVRSGSRGRSTIATTHSAGQFNRAYVFGDESARRRESAMLRSYRGPSPRSLTAWADFDSVADDKLEELLGAKVWVDSDKYKGKSYKGLRFRVLDPEATACECGLKDGDLLLSAGDTRMLSTFDLANWLAVKGRKSGVKMMVIRGDACGYVVWKGRLPSDSLANLSLLDDLDGDDDDADDEELDDNEVEVSGIEVTLKPTTSGRQSVRVAYETSGGRMVHRFSGNRDSVLAAARRLPAEVLETVSAALNEESTPTPADSLEADEPTEEIDEEIGGESDEPVEQPVEQLEAPSVDEPTSGEAESTTEDGERSVVVADEAGSAPVGESTAEESPELDSPSEDARVAQNPAETK